MLIPFIITFSFSTMFYVALTKNFIKAENYRKNYKVRMVLSFVSLLIIFPAIMLPLSRFYLLRRARNLEWVSNGRHQAEKKCIGEYKQKIKNQNKNNELTDEPSPFVYDPQIFKMESKYWVDFVLACRFWSSKPILDAYFSKPIPSDVEMQSL